MSNQSRENGKVWQKNAEGEVFVNMLNYVKLNKTIYLFIVNLIIVIKINSFYKWLLIYSF